MSLISQRSEPEVVIGGVAGDDVAGPIQLVGHNQLGAGARP